MPQKTFSAPLAIIQVEGVAIGKMKNVRLTETIRRSKVTGLGRLNPEELPPVEWSGSLTCSSYSLNFNLLFNNLQKGTYRNSATVDEWANSILLQEQGLEICIMRKVASGNPDPKTGKVSSNLETFAKVGAAFCTREGFDISEGQLSGRDTEFEYLDPILYNNVV